MSENSKALRTLGPFEVSDVNDDILGEVVYNQGVPIVVKQKINNETRFAVVAKDRDLRIVCAGCFRSDMSLADDSRCKKVCSFVKHWDNKDGGRRQSCKNIGNQSIRTVAEKADGVVLDFTDTSNNNNNNNTIETVETTDLIAELKRRGAMEDVVEDATDEMLLSVMKARGIEPLVDARGTKLIHELRRQARKVSVETYYHNSKKQGLTHSSDEVGCTLHEVEEVAHATRRTKRAKVETHFEPRNVTDYR